VAVLEPGGKRRGRPTSFGSGRWWCVRNSSCHWLGAALTQLRACPKPPLVVKLLRQLGENASAIRVACVLTSLGFASILAGRVARVERRLRPWVVALVRLWRSRLRRRYGLLPWRAAQHAEACASCVVARGNGALVAAARSSRSGMHQSGSPPTAYRIRLSCSCVPFAGSAGGVVGEETSLTIPAPDDPLVERSGRMSGDSHSAQRLEGVGG
jgi:hypothetical protein